MKSGHSDRKRMDSNAVVVIGVTDFAKSRQSRIVNETPNEERSGSPPANCASTILSLRVKACQIAQASEALLVRFMLCSSACCLDLDAVAFFAFFAFCAVVSRLFEY